MSIRHMSAIWDSQLYDGPKLLMMLALADWADIDGWSYPSYETLARRVRRNVKTVYRILSELEADGAIRRADGRIGICEPQIMEEVKRRSEASEAKSAPTPPAGPLKKEKRVLKNEKTTTATIKPILKSENEILITENQILTSEKEILKIETPFLIDPSITPDLDPSLTPTAPTADPAPPPAAAVAVPPVDPSSAILRWIGFQDKLGQKDRPGELDPPALLAWAYWVHLEEDKPTRPKNAIALARSQWQKGLRPRDELLALARGWLAMTDDTRRGLLVSLDFSARYGADDPALDEEYPGLPIATAIAVYRATGGQLGPPALSPLPEATAAAITAAREQAKAPTINSATVAPRHNADLWRDALDELEMQMTKDTFAAWLRGTTADETPTGLTIHVRNESAVEWLTNRLHPLIQRTVDALAGHPLTVHYQVWSQNE